MINDYKDGGLKMIDLSSFNKSFFFFDLEIGNYGENAIFFLLPRQNRHKNYMYYQTADVFINEVLQIWAEVSLNESITSLHSYQSQPL